MIPTTKTVRVPVAVKDLSAPTLSAEAMADEVSMNDDTKEDEIEVELREPERMSMADEFERLTRKPSIDSVFTQKRMAQDAYRSSVQQHMADIRMFMNDMNRVKGYVKDELARDWIGDRLKMWDMKLSELRLPDATV